MSTRIYHTTSSLVLAMILLADSALVSDGCNDAMSLGVLVGGGLTVPTMYINTSSEFGYCK